WFKGFFREPCACFFFVLQARRGGLQARRGGPFVVCVCFCFRQWLVVAAVLAAGFFSRWTHPYRLFFNNDGGSSGIAEFAPKFFRANIHPIACIITPGSPHLRCLFFRFS